MQFLKSIGSYLKKHLIKMILLLIVLIGGGYWAYKSFKGTVVETRYVLSTVQKGTVIASVSGSGQVTVLSQVELKAKASGDVMTLSVKEGQEVKANDLLVTLNAKDALKAVRDAQVSLDSAKLAYQKLTQPTDALSILQSENNLAKAQNNLDKAKEAKTAAEDDLNQAYENGYNNVSSAFLDLPTVMQGLNDVLYSNNSALGGSSQFNIDYYTDSASRYNDNAGSFRTDTNTKYDLARKAYDANFQTYKATSRYSDKSATSALIDQTYETTKKIAEALQSANNLIQNYQDRLKEHQLIPASISYTQLSDLASFTGKVNSNLSSLLGSQSTIRGDIEQIVSADRTIAESTQSLVESSQSLAEIKAGVDPLDVQSSKLTITQRENSLRDARDNLANYSIRAPFDGTIAKLTVKLADSIGSGTSIGTLITKQKLAAISLNEVDLAKVKLGQRVTLTFDAIQGLSISGIVTQIDSLGTVSQGVVTYGVQISFDTQDERVKSGMSVSAAIITDMRQDVLTVSNAAIKTSNNSSYVEMFQPPIVDTGGNAGTLSTQFPVSQTVEVGLSDDSISEIISGLKEGDQIITRTITTSSAPAASTAPSLFGSQGNRGATGGAVRMQTVR